MKINESFLDPNDYPEDQKRLVDDFNSKLRDCMGVVTALGKEYHTIWLVDCNTLKMKLYRSTGISTVKGMVDMALRHVTYDKFIEAYVDTYVVSGHETMQKDVSPKVIMDRISEGDLYTIDYMRMDDEGAMTWHQMAFALAGEPRDYGKFILAFRDVDKAVRKHMSDKLYLREQLDIVGALCRDYYNVFKIDLDTGNVMILKLDGYVTKGMDKPGDKLYDYDALSKQYVRDRVYYEDAPAMYDALSFETVKKKMSEMDEYVCSYRVLDNGSIHYCQFTYIPVNPANKQSGILAGFKNVDDVVEGAKERENLITLAETDIMTGILNRGSGEKKVKSAIAGGKFGLFCVADIDSFKKINDNYGHFVGDQVIRGVADILRGESRDRDIVFRLGGDEYVVFAQGILDIKTGNKLTDRIFKRIREFKIPEMGDEGISVSIGAVIVPPKSEMSFEEVYKLADACVYKSKETEGNIVTYHED